MADALFVTKEECSKLTTSRDADLKQIKTALIGEDMRGGIVKDVAETKKDIAEIKKDIANQKSDCHESSLGKKEKAMIYCAVIAASSMIVVELVKAVV
jgi:hypothetical protein